MQVLPRINAGRLRRCSHTRQDWLHLLLDCPALTDSHCDTHCISLPPRLSLSLSLFLGIIHFHTPRRHTHSQPPALIQLPLGYGSAATTGTLFLSSWKGQSIARCTITSTLTEAQLHTAHLKPSWDCTWMKEDFRLKRSRRNPKGTSKSGCINLQHLMMQTVKTGLMVKAGQLLTSMCV